LSGNLLGRRSIVHVCVLFQAIAFGADLGGPCHLKEMSLTVLVDRERRIPISHAGIVGLLVFEVDINALLAE
jgi:hypothetical protein